MIAGEITTKDAWMISRKVVRQAIKEIGYTERPSGFDSETMRSHHVGTLSVA